MNRRTFLQTGLSATIGASFVGNTQQASAQGAPEQPGRTAASSPAQSPVAARKLTLDAYSRHLQWLRTPDEVADAVFETGCDGVMLTVQPYPGHIDPERVSHDLPLFVKTLRQRGLRVTQIQGPELTDATAPQVEAIIRAGSDLGITHYWFGTFSYDFTKPIAPQLDSVKLGIDKFVKLNQKHHTTVMFHTYSMSTAVGSTVWDLLSIMKNFDPRYVGFHWDTGDMALHGGDTWDALMRFAGPYIAGISWEDRSWQQDLGLKGEGGPFPGLSAIPQGGRGRGRGAAGGGPGGGAFPGAAPNAAAGPGGPGEAGGEEEGGAARARTWRPWSGRVRRAAYRSSSLGWINRSGRRVVIPGCAVRYWHYRSAEGRRGIARYQLQWSFDY